MLKLNTPSYLDFTWDKMDFQERDEIALFQAKQAALFAKEHVPFYRTHFKALSPTDISNIKSLEEFTIIIPELTREHVSTNPHYAFLPEDVELEIDPNKGAFRNKSTGGTTSRPVAIFHSTQDWRALSQAIARPIKFDFRNKLDILQSLVVFGLYHGDHITNEIYQTAFTQLGITFINRASTKVNDFESNYALFQDIRPTAILAPPEDISKRQTKGLTLADFLRLDARNPHTNNYRMHHSLGHLQAIFTSSMPISKGLCEYVSEHLQIPYLQHLYGITEMSCIGVTCSEQCSGFHLCYGPNVLLLKNPTKNLLANEDEEGYVLVSKTGATNNLGENIIPTGMTLLNYRTGDYGRLKARNGETCPCGRNTPILHDLRRVEAIRGKLIFGCQVG